MAADIAATFELLFDKNNNIAYKALQELQKASEETDKGEQPYGSNLGIEKDGGIGRDRL